MSQTSILYPLLALVGWTMTVLLMVGGRRLASRLHPREFALGESAAVPPRVTVANRNFINLLEVPVLFYVVCLAIYVSGQVSATAVALAWAFACGSTCSSGSPSRAPPRRRARAHRHPGVTRSVGAALLLFAAAAAAQERARGELAGQPVDTLVDGPVARHYIENYLRGARSDPALDRRFDRLHREAPPPTREALAAIAADFSVDVAAAYCAWRLLQDTGNRALQRQFDAELAAVRAGAAFDGAAAPLILLAPGWLWRTQPETGADFARPRAVLRRMGLASALIETAESGTIENNAATLARAVAAQAGLADAILVSASKAGPEVGWALTQLAASDTPHRAGAWVNIGGILQGSPLADVAMRWPLRWLLRVMALWEPWTYASIRSMQTEPGRERFAQWRRPPGMAAVNFLAVPLSGHISPGAERGYARMAPLGPNDGLTLLADALAPDSRTIVQVGVDHYYLDPEIDLKTAALARVALRLAAREDAPAHH